MPSATVLVIEDEPSQALALSEVLGANGYRALVAHRGTDALDIVERSIPDVVLLDLGLPDVDGVDLCRHLRARLANPIIVVTIDGKEERMVRALDTGADDYVVKPLSAPVLLARIRVALRHVVARAPLVHDEVLTSGDIRLDTAAREVTVGHAAVELHARQFDLLTALMRNEDKLMTYAALVRVVWGMEKVEGRLDALRTSMSKLRKAIGTAAGRPVILTEHNVGYRLVAPDR